MADLQQPGQVQAPPPEAIQQTTQQVAEPNAVGMDARSPILNEAFFAANTDFDGVKNKNLPRELQINGAANVTLSQPAVTYQQPNGQPNVQQPQVVPNQQAFPPQDNNQVVAPPDPNAQNPLLGQPNQPLTNQPQVQASVAPEIETLRNTYETQITGYRTELQAAQDKIVALEAFNADPNKFVAERMPGFVLNKESPYHFDKDIYIQTQVNTKFGENFEYNPAEAYKVGTESYAYRNFVEQAGKDADKIIETASTSVTKQTEAEQLKTQEAQNIVNQQIAAVKQKYGLDDVTFKTQVWDELEKYSDADRLMLLADAIMLKRAETNRTQNIQQQSQLLQYPSLSQMSGNGGVQTGNIDSKAQLNGLFGSQRAFTIPGATVN